MEIWISHHAGKRSGPSCSPDLFGRILLATFDLFNSLLVLF